MGNLISDSATLYLLDLPAVKPSDGLTLLDDDAQIPSPLRGKIMIPVSRIPQRRTVISQYHHHVVLVEDGQREASLSRWGTRGVPVVHLEALRSPQSCLEAQFDCRFCPLPIVLERFHDSYVKNYVNSFWFYGVRALAYGKVEQFLHGECSHRFLVCSNYELEQLSFKLRNRPGAGDPNRRLTILCFCNREHYSFSKRVELFLQKEGIDVLFFQNMLDIVERVAAEGLAAPPSIQVRNERVLFYLSEKEKEAEYLTKMAKRMQKSLRNVAVERVSGRPALLQRVEKAPYSIVVVSGDPKELRGCLELHEDLEREGLEDRVIFVRRENEITEKLTQRLCAVAERPKYRRVALSEKEIVFFGTVESFKTVLRSFPTLRFKRFVDSGREREKILPFLLIPTEVVVSTVRLCPCQEQFANQQIQCTVILLHGRGSSTVRTFERQEGQCERERWFADEEELYAHFSSQKGEVWSLGCEWASKRAGWLGKTLSEVFGRMKEKKTILYNRLNDAMLLFSSEYYTLDQLASSLMRLFCSKLMGSYEQECLFPRVRAALYEEVAFLAESRRVEAGALDALEREESRDVWGLAEVVMGLMVEFGELREEVNSIWTLLLHQDRKEHLTQCPTLLFLLLLSFTRTNFVTFADHTLQGLTLLLPRSAVDYDRDNLNTFRSKSRSNFVYNIEFLCCEVIRSGDPAPDPADTVIRLEGNELMSFALCLPLVVRGRKAIICPLSRFEITTQPNRPPLLKLSLQGQQKLLERFSQLFLEDSAGQLKLIPEEREGRRFDAFLESMAHSRFETAGYLLKRVAREEGLANQDCLNAFHVLYHLKRRETAQAQQRLRQDKYFDFLSRVVQAQVEEGGCGGAEKEAFSSSKRIEEGNKEYQNIEETSNNESFDSAMVQTDPDMMKQLSSDYRLLNHALLARARSPSSKINNVLPHRRPPGKVPIRRKNEISISDKLSECGRREEKPLNIVVLPPIRKHSGEAAQEQSSTFGSKFLTEYSSLSSDMKSVKEECGPLLRMKSTRSDAGDRLLLCEDGVIESSPMLHKRNSKQSQFLLVERERTSGESEESRGELLSLLEPQADAEVTEEHQQTGNFNFPSPSRQEPLSLVDIEGGEPERESIHEVAEEIEEEVEQVEQVEQEMEEQGSEPHEPQPSISSAARLASPEEKPFPIKKGFFQFPPARKSLTELHDNLALLESPLRRIEEQRSSQFSLSASTAKFLLCSPEKENGDPARPKEAKLFTFYRIADPLKPRFSLSSNKNSLNLSNNDELRPIDEATEPQLFCKFNPEPGNAGNSQAVRSSRESDLSDLHSISSIEIQEAEQVYPEELLHS